MMYYQWLSFPELTVRQLYSLLKLRSEVFVVEQHCFFLDPDGKDQHALHLLGTENDEVVAYLRVFLPTHTQPNIYFGRVVTAASVRQKGYGKQLMEELLAYCTKHCPDVPIQCSAQSQLEHFYAGFGFKTISQPYLDAGIPHIDMKKT